MSRIGRRMKHLCGDQQGVTLVELAVTFALVGILMAASAAVLISGLNLYTRITAASHAELVADLLLEKISGEISAAVSPEHDGDGYYFWLEQNEDAGWVAFQNRNHRPVAIYASTSSEEERTPENLGRGQLYVKYYALPEKGTAEVNWHYDSKVYMGYQIENLSFRRDDPDGHPNVVRIDLTLKHSRSGFAYTTFRYVKSYDFNQKSDAMGVPNDGSTELPEEAEIFQMQNYMVEKLSDNVYNKIRIFQKRGESD